MPCAETVRQSVDGQDDFSGGMNCLANAAANQYFYGENIVIRDGRISTRPGTKTVMPQNPSGQVGFNFGDMSFSEFSFERILVPGVPQGVASVKANAWPYPKILMCAGGFVFTLDFFMNSSPVATMETVASSENVSFIQASNSVFMFRGEGRRPLVWSFDNERAGFVHVAAPDEISEGVYWDSIPSARAAAYALGRLWVASGADELAASDILAFNNWDQAQRTYACSYGDGDYITAVFPFKDNIIFVFKQNSVHAFTGIDGADLENIQRVTVDKNHGAVGPNAVVQVGEDVWFLAFGGIYSIQRNEYNKLQGTDAAVSSPVHSIIRRIDWVGASVACATTFANYVLFAVPIDNDCYVAAPNDLSKRTYFNNAVLVYDLITKTWVGVWRADKMKPMLWASFRERLFYTGPDMVLRQMFADGPTDADWNESDYIDQKIVTRMYRHGDGAIRKKLGLCEIIFDHQNPLISVSAKSEDSGTDVSVFDGVEFDQSKYDVSGLPDYDETNINDDFNLPNRKDYTLLCGAAGFYLTSGGVWLGDSETHSVRFLQNFVDQNGVRFTIENSRGRISIKSISVLGQAQRMGIPGR